MVQKLCTIFLMRVQVKSNSFATVYIKCNVCNRSIYFSTIIFYDVDINMISTGKVLDIIRYGVSDV